MARVCIEIDENGNGSTEPIVRTFETTLGDGTQSDFSVDHNLHHRNVLVQAFDLNTGEVIGDVDYTLNSIDRTTLSFATPPAANSVRVQLLAVRPRLDV